MGERKRTFVQIFEKDSKFASVLDMMGSQVYSKDLLYMFLLATVLALIGFATVDVLPLLTASILALFLQFGMGCLTFSAAACAVELQLIITIASFRISNGLKESEAAAALAQLIIIICGPIGRIDLLICI